VKETAMGIFRQRIEVGRTEDGPFLSVEAVVDTGATYTLLPRRIVAQLGIAPRNQRELLLADGRRVTRDLAPVFVRLDGDVMSTPCILDDEAQEALLGAVTLEEFGLAVDPVRKQLVPAPGYLL